LKILFGTGPGRHKGPWVKLSSENSKGQTFERLRVKLEVNASPKGTVGMRRRKETRHGVMGLVPYSVTTVEQGRATRPSRSYPESRARDSRGPTPRSTPTTRVSTRRSDGPRAAELQQHCHRGRESPRRSPGGTSVRSDAPGDWGTCAAAFAPGRAFQKALAVAESGATSTLLLAFKV
jgi:hypothetical protein